MHEDLRLRAVSGAAVHAGVEGLQLCAGGESDRGDNALDRQVDADLPADHALHHAAAANASTALADSLSPDGWPVRVLLRLSSSDDMGLARQVLRPPRHVGRHSEEALHHRGHGSSTADVATGDYVHKRMDWTPWRQAMVDAAQIDLCECSAWRDSFLLAGKGRYS